VSRPRVRRAHRSWPQRLLLATNVVLVVACLGAIRRPELYHNFAIHLFVMLPAASLMCWIGTRVDAALHFAPWSGGLGATALGLSLIGLGGLWVWYVYGYLYLSGGGSPGTHVDGGPTALVDTGPYTVIRHPSVLGKLAGVVGLGVLFGSTVFLLGFVRDALLTMYLAANAGPRGVLVLVVRAAFGVLQVALLVRIVTSWIGGAYSAAGRLAFRLTEWFLGPLRRALPTTGGIDFSPMLAWFLLSIVQNAFLSIL